MDKPSFSLFLGAVLTLNLACHSTNNAETTYNKTHLQSGVKAGKVAGCFVAACPDPRFSKEERAEFEAIADVVIDDLSQFDMSIFGIPHN